MAWYDYRTYRIYPSGSVRSLAVSSEVIYNDY